MTAGVMTVGVMSVGEITVGVMTVGVMRRPRKHTRQEKITIFRDKEKEPLFLHSSQTCSEMK